MPASEIQTFLEFMKRKARPTDNDFVCPLKPPKKILGSRSEHLGPSGTIDDGDPFANGESQRTRLRDNDHRAVVHLDEHLARILAGDRLFHGLAGNRAHHRTADTREIGADAMADVTRSSSARGSATIETDLPALAFDDDVVHFLNRAVFQSAELPRLLPAHD